MGKYLTWAWSYNESLKRFLVPSTFLIFYYRFWLIWKWSRLRWLSKILFRKWWLINALICNVTINAWINCAVHGKTRMCVLSCLFIHWLQDQLKTTLNSLEERLRGLQIIKRDCTHIATHIKVQYIEKINVYTNVITFTRHKTQNTKVVGQMVMQQNNNFQVNGAHNTTQLAIISFNVCFTITVSGV